MGKRPPIPASIRRNVLLRFSGHCVECLSSITKVAQPWSVPACFSRSELDHYLVPFSIRRGHDESDLVLLCPTHHAEKTRQRDSTRMLQLRLDAFEEQRKALTRDDMLAYADRRAKVTRPSVLLQQLWRTFGTRRFKDANDLYALLSIEADALRRAGKITAALDLLTSIIDAGLPNIRPEIESRLALSHAQALAKIGSFTRAYDSVARAIKHCHSAIPEPLLRAMRATAANCRRQGFLTARLAGDTWELPRHVKVGQQNVEASNLINRGVDLRQAGQFADAIREQKLAVRLATDFGDLRNAAIARGNLGQTHRDQGHLAAAREEFTIAIAMRHAIEDRWGEGLYQVMVGQINAAIGENEKALVSYHRGIQLLLDEHDYHITPNAYRALARALDHAGETTRARGARESARTLHRDAQARGIMPDRLFTNWRLQPGRGLTRAVKH